MFAPVPSLPSTATPSAGLALPVGVPALMLPLPPLLLLAVSLVAAGRHQSLPVVVIKVSGSTWAQT
jgi:hypothetical protein